MKTSLLTKCARFAAGHRPLHASGVAAGNSLYSVKKLASSRPAKVGNVSAGPFVNNLLNNSFNSPLNNSLLAQTRSMSTSTMDDEYGAMDSAGLIYTFPGDFVLENGAVVPNATLCYNTYGTLNENADNAIVVCHALTGNSSLHSWWGELLGPGKAFDTDKYFVVCSNILGSCYGSTSPKSIDPRTGIEYGMSFPDISVQDTVRLQLAMLEDGLRVSSVKCVIGGSFGGMQTLEFMAQGGGNGFVRSGIPIACGAAHTAWQIGISETQRQAIYKDPKWMGGNFDPEHPPLDGLNIARQIGMVSYRTPVGYQNKFGRKVKEGGNESSPLYGQHAKWQVKSYLEYQGEKFLSRFDPVTYIKLTEQMDSHDIGRGRGGIEAALNSIEIPSTILGIDSDVLYPYHEQEEVFEGLGSATKKIIEIKSDAGHDGFLLEQEQVGAAVTNFLNEMT